MAGMPGRTTDIAAMPRGGFRASCLDRLLETDRQEYLDRDDVDDRVKRRVVGALEWTGRVFGHHQRFAHLVLDLVADIPDPRILELGAGHGAVSRLLLDAHPTARLTVTDLDPVSVAALANSELWRDERVSVRTMDATAIDAPDGSFDLALFALSFHHLPPAAAARALAEGTRVADTLLLIDLPRPPAPLHLARLATMLPFSVVGPLAPFVHDGMISSLRCYSPAALRDLARHAGVDIEFRRGRGLPQVSVVRRR
ncbi:class I SAM-dependent methyltransferase [Mycobacterium sp. MYCO198283]|uniref:class I SAM-dependent methyltransferase n=1 Tax=Mycobacterium sp. MYCO198283 TaxID=2883505 RepID=UPI001E2DFF30|nr:class I SAM-dependent methyltransferase [Mycobacterium sp. MYCO198283]MCG5432850.1 class I SAM-dependent methyltransferase [Mycobacterium sp. MYCO198283]